MTRSRRATVALLTVLVLTLASRTDPGMRLVENLLGSRASLYLGGQTVPHDATTHTAVGEQPADVAQLPVPPPAGAAARLAAAVSVAASAHAEQGYAVETRLLTKDAKPMNGITVRYYDVVELLGPREMLIGSAVTDGQGRASFTYLPQEAGRHEVIVRSAALDQYVATEGRATFQADVVAPASYSRELLPLSSFTGQLPWVAGGVLLAVWALFAVALLGTGRRILVGARIATPPLRTARGVAGAGPAARSKTREDQA